MGPFQLLHTHAHLFCASDWNLSSNRRNGFAKYSNLWKNFPKRSRFPETLTSIRMLCQIGTPNNGGCPFGRRVGQLLSPCPWNINGCPKLLLAGISKKRTHPNEHMSKSGAPWVVSLWFSWRRGGDCLGPPPSTAQPLFLPQVLEGLPLAQQGGQHVMQLLSETVHHTGDKQNGFCFPFRLPLSQPKTGARATPS